MTMTDDEQWELPDLSGVKLPEEMTPEERSEIEDLLSAELAEHEWDMIEEAVSVEAEPVGPTFTKAQAAYAVRQRMMTVEALYDQPPVKWFLEGLLPEAPRTIVHGAGGSKKSFLVLDWMLCAAHSMEWQGRAVRPGKVLYILGEGVGGLSKRLTAWAAQHDLNPRNLQIDLMAVPINLFTLSEQDIGIWHGLLAGLEYDYVVFDTLHTSMAGGEESSSKDIGLVYENASRICGEAKVFFLHHDTKVGDSSRGSSSIRDDADVVVQLVAVDSRTSKLSPDKIRDADDFEPLSIRFEVHGEGIESSLYVAEVGVKAETSGPAALRCQAEMTRLGLDPDHSIDSLVGQLRANGFPTSRTTVAAARAAMRGGEYEWVDD